MLKNKMSLGVVSLLSLTLVSNSVSFSVMATAQAADSIQDSARADKSFGVIARALKKARKAVKSGLMQPKDAMTEFSQTLILEDITIANVDNFVAATQSPKEHEKFQVRVKDAMAGVSGGAALSGPEFAEVLSVAVRGAANDGLAYDGCFQMDTVGWLLVGAGVIVGVIALLKTKGTVSWQKKYENEKMVRQQQYNDDKYAIDNFQTVIPQQIVSINGQISTAKEGIAYQRGLLVGLDPESQAAIDANAKITAYQNNINNWSSDIVDLSLRMAFLSVPANKSAELAQLALVFNTDISNISATEAQKIADVPRQKKIAGTMGIVAGAAAAVGTAFVLIGDVGDCK